MEDKTLSYCKAALPLLLGLAAVFLFFSQSVLSLRAPDPVKRQALHVFGDQASSGRPQNMRMEGFLRSGAGISLAPGEKGLCSWQVIKEKGQGCLIRAWLYGAREYPCELTVTIGDATPHTLFDKDKNHTGEVYDLSREALQATKLLFSIKAENSASYATVISDKLEIFICDGAAAAPVMPDMARPAAVFFIVYCLAFIVLNRQAGRKPLQYRIILCCILFTAFFVRWHELVRVAGAALDPDAQGYFSFARALRPFSSTGFYSATFGIREPLYLLVAKAFLELFGYSETHLRFVSCCFSVLVVGLVWQLGKKWLSEPVGLLAAALTAAHPYLIELSARGLREEFFTSLLLLMLIVAGGQPKQFLYPRTAATGLLIGALALTRSETIPMMVLILATLIIFAKRRWNPRNALAAFGIGILLYAPHVYGAYQQHGHPFYTMNIQARFYANLEFAGRPGFPTQQELAANGMCSGPNITPLEYYFKLHSVPEVLARSAIGLGKIMSSMPLAFAQGKGMFRKIASSYACMQEKLSWSACSSRFVWLEELTGRDIADYSMAALMLMALAAGIICLLSHRHFFICSCLVTLTAHLAFLVTVGIDQRLAVHVYPLIATCCAYAIFHIWGKAQQRFSR